MFLFYFASRILIKMSFWAITNRLWFYQRNLFRSFLSRSFILLSGCLFYEAPIRIRIKYIMRNTRCMGIKLFKWEAFSFLAYRSLYEEFRAKQMKTNGFSRNLFMSFLTGSLSLPLVILFLTKHREVSGLNKTHIYRYTEYSTGNLFSSLMFMKFQM